MNSFVAGKMLDRKEVTSRTLDEDIARRLRAPAAATPPLRSRT
jgi:hypothetical protein